LEFWEFQANFVQGLYSRLGNCDILCNAGNLGISKLSVFSADGGFDSRRLPKKLSPKAYDRCGHQPVITAAGYSSQADRFQIGGRLAGGGAGQPCLLGAIFKVCSFCRGQLANRLEELGSSSEVDRFRVQIRGLVLTAPKIIGADPTRSARGPLLESLSHFCRK
jgi:hypothetical protein